MDTDKVLALARQSANAFHTHAMEVTEYDFTDDTIQEFAALIEQHVKEQVIKDGRRSPEQVKKAVEDEREACALIADQKWISVNGLADSKLAGEIARAIRARSANE